MKRLRYILIASVAAALSGCNGFLSIEPLNDIVLENYWTEKADVMSVLNSCYAQLESADCIQRMAIWGEARSDNMQSGSGTNNDLNQIFKENLLETNRFANWSSFYQCINRCNTVIYYAPEVSAKDPNFTQAEMRATIAEATTLRALCYFYLIRTFRDVPYVTEPSKDDSQQYQIPATPFDQVLDNLIADVERVKDEAVKSYGENSVENTCRITRYACYALLADLYLWKGDYQACIDNCDKVIDQKILQYEEEREKNPTTYPVELYGRYPLVSETQPGSSYAGNAYTEIFGTGNSFESIFELNFVSNQSVSNLFVRDFYGSSSSRTGQIGVPPFIYENAYAGTNDYFRKTDCRFLENILETNNKGYVQKYVAQRVQFRTSTTTGAAPTVTSSARSTNYANWILYRLSDVILMRAEAEVELAGNVEVGQQLTAEQTQHYQNAFDGVMAVWRRANNKRTSTTDLLVYDDYAIARSTMEDLVLGERQRELMFEGKRWFDFVRLCRREGENSRMITKVLPKFQENSAAIRVKLSSKDIIWWPYHRDEIKQNPFLIQNPAYETDKTEQNI
ncbi:MAG: RagB/SusD family nutrient uptake outer membrane protein [Bacteroidaceae bacterium]|nr:RagB/SusD family nutrient uptake outer membrane protein [Bacteroidaceae bacterium]